MTSVDVYSKNDYCIISTFIEDANSVSKGNLQYVYLGRPDSYFRIMIPPGLWYGFTCISEFPALLVNCADIPHDPQESEIRMYDDISIPYRW